MFVEFNDLILISRGYEDARALSVKGYADNPGICIEELNGCLKENYLLLGN